MKILHISRLYPVFYNKFYGRAIHAQTREVKKLGYEVKVISPIPQTPFPIKYFSLKWKRYSEISQKTSLEGIEVFYPRYIDFPKTLFFESSGERMYHGIKDLVAYIYKHFKFDLIHAHMALPDGRAATLIKKEYNKPLVLTLRSSDLDLSIFKNKKIFHLVKEVAKHADVVLVPSPHLRRKAKEYFKITPKIIPNGIYSDEVIQDNDSLSREYKNRKIILSISQLIKIKGVDFNLRAMAKLKKKYTHLIYLIIGDGPEKKYLKSLARDLKIENNVEFLGKQPHKKAMEYISICDLFSLPSWRETFGLVYLEAMANRKPIIGCQDQGIDGIIKERETGLLVKPKDVDSLTRQIDFLLSNPERSKQIGERAQKLVLENYTWREIAKRLNEVYRIFK